MIWKALDAKPVKSFAKALATEMLAQLGPASDQGSKKFQSRAGKVLAQAELRVDDFKRQQPQNWFQRSLGGNAFLWTLKEGGCPDAYADELSRWFLAKLAPDGS